MDGPRPSARLGGDDVADVGAWFVRRFAQGDGAFRAPMTPEQWSAAYGRFDAWRASEASRNVAVTSLLRVLEDLAPMVNPTAAFVGHTRKHHQVATLARAGLRVPPFLLSNDPAALRAFARGGRTVHKPVAGEAHVQEADEDALAALAEKGPVLAQRLVEGRHVRAYVVGDRVVGAAEIRFDRSQGPDYRASQQGTEAVALAPAVAEACLRAARAVGMDWTGLDLVLAKDGPWFLETNPAPMFANFERATGAPVAAALAALLVERAKQ